MCHKIWQNKNKHKIKEYSQKWYDENKDHVKKTKIAWDLKNPNYNQEYYQKNKDDIKRAVKKYYKSNDDKIKKYRSNNDGRIKKGKTMWQKSFAKYETYVDRLTIDEKPILADDGISLEVKCRYCGKYFSPTNSSVKRRIDSLNNAKNGENNLYCSNGCKHACPIYRQVIYSKDHKPATSREVQPQLRQLVLLRDNYTCQKCSKIDTELHCHHILPLNESPIESADVNNCITLCKECHKKAHKISGCNYYELRCSG